MAGEAMAAVRAYLAVMVDGLDVGEWRIHTVGAGQGQAGLGNTRLREAERTTL